MLKSVGLPNNGLVHHGAVWKVLVWAIALRPRYDAAGRDDNWSWVWIQIESVLPPVSPQHRHAHVMDAVFAQLLEFFVNAENIFLQKVITSSCLQCKPRVVFHNWCFDMT